MAYTKLSTLPVGTKFRVLNGSWDGEIIEINGKKHLYVVATEEKVDLTTSRKDYVLDISVRYRPN